MTEDTAAIAFEHVTKTFDGGRVTALADVSLTVPVGQFLAIVGTSGSGKTTLLRLANRLIEPDQGTVRFQGENVRDVDPIALRRRIGMVFQNAGLFPHMTVAENIGITPRLMGAPVAETRARVDELIALVRLDPGKYRDRYPRELSGGERQRVGVARALAARPRVVLMDEPFGALDLITRDAVGTDYRLLHDSLSLTTVMITHDIVEALLHADRIAVMRSGRVIAEGTTAELSANRGGYVGELLSTPRKQAERLQALLLARRGQA